MTKLKFTDNKISSIDIKIVIMFFLLNIIPDKPIKNNEIATTINLFPSIYIKSNKDNKNTF